MHARDHLRFNHGRKARPSRFEKWLREAGQQEEVDRIYQDMAALQDDADTELVEAIRCDLKLVGHDSGLEH